jgi:hypothetical protein
MWAEDDALENEIRGLGVNNLEQRHSFQSRNEGEVGDFLGIRIQKKGKDSFVLTQTGPYQQSVSRYRHGRL